MYWFIIDIFMVFIIVLTTFSAMRRGFVTSLVRLLGIMVAIIAAIIASKLLSGVVFDMWFREKLIAQVADRITGASDAASIARAISSGLIGILIGVFDDLDALTALIEKNSANDSRILAEAVVDSVIRDSVEPLIGMVLFLLAFIIIICITVIVVKVSGVLMVIPVVSGINRFLGALFGIAYGVGICFMITMIFALFFEFTGNIRVYEEMINDNTLLFALLFRLNPFR